MKPVESTNRKPDDGGEKRKLEVGGDPDGIKMNKNITHQIPALKASIGVIGEVNQLLTSRAVVVHGSLEVLLRLGVGNLDRNIAGERSGRARIVESLTHCKQGKEEDERAKHHEDGT